MQIALLFYIFYKNLCSIPVDGIKLFAGRIYIKMSKGFDFDNSIVYTNRISYSMR